MRLFDFLADGGQIFDSTGTYPEWLDTDLQTAVQAQLFDYGLRVIQPRAQAMAAYMEKDLEEVIQEIVARRITRNDYKYRTLLATEAFEYDPIENYHMVESGTTTAKKGAQTDGVVYGQDQTSTLYGHTDTQTNANTDTRTLANSDTQTFADTQTQTFQNTDTRTHQNTDTRTHTDTDTLTLDTIEGKQSYATISGTSGSTEGSRTDTTDTGIYGYNSATAAPSESVSFTKGQQINSGNSSSNSNGSDTIQRTGTETTAHTGSIADAHTGTIADAHTGTIGDAHTGTITDAHTGTITDGHTGTITNAESGTDTVTRSQHTDTHTSGARDDSGSHSLTRSGNIGVTTSQQMIMSEREVAEFSFLSVLTRDLVNSFCMGVM